jgi:hypothetical protein
MRCIVEEKTNADYNLWKVPGIGGYLASVSLVECGDLRRSITKDSLVSTSANSSLNGNSESREAGTAFIVGPNGGSYLVEAAW